LPECDPSQKHPALETAAAVASRHAARSLKPALISALTASLRREGPKSFLWPALSSRIFERQVRNNALHSRILVLELFEPH